MKKIQIFIEHDIVIRHFLHNHSFQEIENNYDVQYVFADYSKRINMDIDSLGLKSYLKIPADGVRVGSLRQLAKIHSLRVARKNKKYVFVTHIWKKTFGIRTYAWMVLYSLPLIYEIYKKKVIRHAGEYQVLNEVIAAFRPDAILHPSVLDGLFIYDLATISKKLKIPFVALMNSWDNPSTKAQFLALPDRLAVWGEQTKQHAIEFMGMEPDKVVVMGSAQFEVYRRKPSKIKEVICHSIGVEPTKKLILYAGSSKSINEIEHLELLEKAVDDGLLQNCYIIFRPHPWRAPAKNEKDFFDVNWKHVSMDPSMLHFYNTAKSTESSKINLTDYMDTHNILTAIDLLVSNMSTILLEGALHGKPVLCMISRKDMAENDFLNVTVNAIFFQELIERLDIRLLENRDEIAFECRRLIEMAQGKDFADRQQEKTRFFVEMGHKSYSEKLKDLIEQVLSENKFEV